MLVDPLGVVRIDLGPAAGVAVGEVDAGLVGTVRATVPSLYNRQGRRVRQAGRRPGAGIALSGSATARTPGPRRPGRRLKPTPVSVVPDAVRAVMAWMPGPDRPRPLGVNAFHAAPFAEVHTTTSW